MTRWKSWKTGFVIVFVCLLLPLSLRAENGVGGSSDRPTLTINPHDKGHPSNAFRGERRAVGADLYAFKLWFYGGNYIFERLPFRVYVKSDTKTVNPGKNYSLWKDADGNGKIDPQKDSFLSSGTVDDKGVVFFRPFTISSGETSFIVRADFPELASGTLLVINLDPKAVVIKNESGVEAVVSLGGTLYAAEHYESYPPLEVRALLASPVIVGQQDVVLFIDVRYLQGIEPFWADLKEVRGWTLKGYPEMSEITGFDLFHRRIILTISQPPGGLALGSYNIPELTLRYKDSLSKTGDSLKARTKLLVVKKELVHAEVRVPRNMIAVADPIPYELSFFMDPSYVIPDDYLSDMRRRDFWGDFRISGGILSIVDDVGLRTVRYKVTLSYVGPPTRLAVLPEEKIPYIKKDNLTSKLLAYDLPAVEFPYRPVAIGSDFDPADLWRDVVREEVVFAGAKLRWLVTMGLAGLGGLIAVFLGGREFVAIIRKRREKSLTLWRQVRSWLKMRRFLLGGRVSYETVDGLGEIFSFSVNQDEMALAALDLSSLVREYVGSVAGKSREFVRSAYFSDWFRGRYPEEGELLDILKRTELSMIASGIDTKIILEFTRREDILHALGRISRKERKKRWREKFSWRG